MTSTFPRPDIFDPWHQFWLARACRAAYRGLTAESTADILSQLYGPWERSGSFLLPPRNPHVEFFRTSRDLLIVAAGTESREQAVAIAGGQLAPDDAFPGGKAQRLFAESGRNIYTAITTQQATGYRDVILVGHSLGGAAVILAGLLQARVAGPDRVQVITFGSPAPGDQMLAGSLRILRLVRVMNFGDPVPSLPSNAVLEGALAALFGLAGFVTVAGYYQPRGGVLQLPGGDRRYINDPPSSLSDLKTFLFTQSEGREDLFGLDHDIKEYSDRLKKYILARNIIAPPVLAGASIQSREVVSPIGETSTPIFTIGGPMSQLVYIPPGSRAIAQTIGPKGSREYRVVWQGHTIVNNATHSRAHVVAKWLNKFLRVLQPELLVNDQTLEAALRNYITNATDPGGEFLPIMAASGA